MSFAPSKSNPEAVKTSLFGADLVVVSTEPKRPWDMGIGQHACCILPSVPNWREFQANDWTGYEVGVFFSTMALNGRTFRVHPSGDNPLTQAYWQLYRELVGSGGFKGTIMEKLATAGFKASLFERALVNVVRWLPSGEMSPVMWLSLAAGQGQDGMASEYARLVEVIVGVAQGPGNFIGVEPETSVVACLNVDPGTAKGKAIIGPIFAATDPNTAVIMTANQTENPNYKAEDLAKAVAWGTSYDDLPGLDEVPALRKFPEACEVLGLARP